MDYKIVCTKQRTTIACQVMRIQALNHSFKTVEEIPSVLFGFLFQNNLGTVTTKNSLQLCYLLLEEYYIYILAQLIKLGDVKLGSRSNSIAHKIGILISGWIILGKILLMVDDKKLNIILFIVIVFVVNRNAIKRVTILLNKGIRIVKEGKSWTKIN